MAQSTKNRAVKMKVLLEKKDRLSIWRKVKGLWKNRKPDPVAELRQMRREW